MLLKIKPYYLVVLNFYPPLGFNFAKKLKRVNCKVIFKPINKFYLPSTKSRITQLRKWDINEFPCKIFNLIYIGQTKHNLKNYLK